MTAATAARDAGLERPIIILGFARSGTTMLGYLFQRHPQVSLWDEPRPVWMHGNAYRDDDELAADDARPEVIRYIRERFSEHVREDGGARLVEKTPSNCLRVPFVRKVLPDCRIIHMVRDGRAVVRSVLQQQTQPTPARRYRKRIREIPLRDWPAYAPLFFRTVWRSQILGKSASMWGPKPRMWKSWMSLPPHVRVARQWRTTVEIALRDARALGAESYLELHYEDFVRDPMAHLERMLSFVDLPPSPEMEDYIRGRVDETLPERRHEALAPEVVRDIETETRPLLEHLGYPV